MNLGDIVLKGLVVAIYRESSSYRLIIVLILTSRVALYVLNRP
jgi:hypothetical protein